MYNLSCTAKYWTTIKQCAGMCFHAHDGDLLTTLNYLPPSRVSSKASVLCAEFRCRTPHLYEQTAEYHLELHVLL